MIVDGFAANDVITGCVVVAGVTVTVAVAVVVPVGLTAVRVYVVFVVGNTVTDVLETTLVNVLLLSIVELALATVHPRTEPCPETIEAGEAVNDEIVGAGIATVA